MKIGVVIPSFYPAVVYGGTIFSSLNTCRELTKLGHQVQVSTTNTNMYSRLDVPVNKWQSMDGFKVKYYNETKIDKFSFPLLVNLWKDIRQADIIHVQAIFNSPTPIALFYCWLFRKPVLLSPRGVLGDWIMNQGNGFKKQWLRFLIKPFSNCIFWHATAEQEKQEILSHFPKANIRVIPNGIDLSFYDVMPYMSKEEYCRKFLGENIRSEHIIVSMGRIHKKKGFDLLIKAFANLKKNISDAILIIAGQDEGELDTLKKLCIELEIQDAVFFIGSIEGENKRDLLVHADVFALTSHNENFGNVYAEALASGTPIVASKFTPWEEVEQAECGYWISLDTKEIEQALFGLLNSDKRDEFRIHAKKYVRKFGWTAIAAIFSEEMKLICKED